MIRQINTGTIVKLTKINSYIYDMWIRVDIPFTFKAGQFVSLFVNDTESRAFSIASSPRKAVEENIIRLIIGPHPGGKTEILINNVQEGSKVKFRGPYGIFTLENTIPKMKDLVDPVTPAISFVATSTGIAPLLSMLEYLRDIKYEQEVKMYLGMRFKSDLICQDEFAEYEKQLKFHYTYAVSKPTETDQEDAKIKFGYVTDLACIHSAPTDYTYLCGSTKTVSDISAKLKEHNFQNVFFENYG